MEIKTKRLTLRPIQVGDEKEIHEYAGDQSLTMMFFLPNDTFEETAAFVQENAEEWNSEDQTSFEFVILLDGRIIGGCDCDLGHSADRSYATLGWIIHKDYRNHGYASEAASAILDFAFENLKINKVYAQCDINNPASFGVMRKIGMKCINDKGTRTYPRTGKTSGEYTCMMTRDEWERMTVCGGVSAGKQVVLLNGPSSSGKSTLAGALQALTESRGSGRYEVVSIDDFMKVPPNETIYEDDVYKISGGMYEKALEILGSGSGVIIDHVITSERIFTQLKKMLFAYPLRMVHVSCSLDVLRERERARGDRCPGSAEASAEYLYPKAGYELTVDTSRGTPAGNALLIFEMLFEKA